MSPVDRSSLFEVVVPGVVEVVGDVVPVVLPGEVAPVVLLVVLPGEAVPVVELVPPGPLLVDVPPSV